MGDLGSILGLGRSPGGGHGNSLQNSCLENPMDSGGLQQSMGGRKSDMTEQLSTTKHKLPNLDSGKKMCIIS